MKDCKQEWIRFDDREPNQGESIWIGGVIEEAMAIKYHDRFVHRQYTHWMPCERPDRPLPEKAPEELALEDHLSTHPLTTFEETWHTAIRWERNRKK